MKALFCVYCVCLSFAFFLPLESMAIFFAQSSVPHMPPSCLAFLPRNSHPPTFVTTCSIKIKQKNQGNKMCFFYLPFVDFSFSECACPCVLYFFSLCVNVHERAHLIFVHFIFFFPTCLVYFPFGKYMKISYMPFISLLPAVHLLFDGCTQREELLLSLKFFFLPPPTSPYHPHYLVSLL